MKRIAIVGGETHIGEITQLSGSELEIVGALVSEDQKAHASETFKCPLFKDESTLFAEAKPEIVAVANENNQKAGVILRSLDEGCDVVVDKPLGITMEEHSQIVGKLADCPDRRLLMLLTLRGQPLWAGLRGIVLAGAIGTPAYCHVRMAVRLKRAQRPPWFLDVRQAGGLFLDLLIHGIDQVEWTLNSKVTALSALTGNLGDPSDEHLRDHAAVFCELESGASAVIEGQRMLPDTKGSDYRMHVAGTEGYADLDMVGKSLTVTNSSGAETDVTDLPDAQSVVGDWLSGGNLVGQEASVRANYLSVLATRAAEQHVRIEVE
jgi:predicted dehydrogenase